MASKNIQFLVDLCDKNPYMEIYLLIALDSYSTHINNNVEEVTKEMEGSIIAPRVVVESAAEFTSAYIEHAKNPPVDYFQKPIREEQIYEIRDNSIPVYLINLDKYTEDVRPHIITFYSEGDELVSIEDPDGNETEEVEIRDLSLRPKRYL